MSALYWENPSDSLLTKGDHSLWVRKASVADEFLVLMGSQVQQEELPACTARAGLLGISCLAMVSELPHWDGLLWINPGPSETGRWLSRDSGDGSSALAFL